MKKTAPALVLLLFIVSLRSFSQAFYNPASIQKIEINFSQANWDYILDTAAMNAGGYVMAQSVKVNGILFDSVGVKYKGNSSYDSTYQKNPFHIELDSYKNQDYQGYKDIKLSNCYQDPSMIREVLAYNILNNYMHSPKANFAQLYVNGTYRGVYSNTESITKTFCANHFFSNSGTFIKCNPNVTPSTNTKSNLKYINSDSSSYKNYYEIKSEYGWKNLVALCDSVTNKPANISSVIDVDRAVWMLAFNNVLVNLDSYSGAFCQNYYLYKDLTGHYSPVVWDLNMSFGGFPFVGNSNSSLGSLSITNMQNMPASIHSSDVHWPLIGAIYNNAMYKRMYIAHMRTILKEYFANNKYVNDYNQYKSVVDTAVQSDTKKFFSYAQFQNALTTNYSVGSYSVPGIQNLMTSRWSYLQSTADFTASTPTISGVAATVATPTLYAPVTLTANVVNTNSTSVYLGYRFLLADKFTRVLMYDDGAHNDGGAGDNIYGATFTLNANQSQYYIYAENNSAGIFSPERAEHEYHTLNALQSPVAGQIVINEFLANNEGDVTNEFNLYQDWIELYNTSSAPVSLGGFYITDDYSNKSKYAFAQNTIVPSNGFLILWADNNAGSGTQMHLNFKLNEGGEQIMLSDGLTGVIDSVTFANQSADVSMGRCPDGTGAFAFLPITSYSLSNCVVGFKENMNVTNGFDVYPNPAKNLFTIRLNDHDGSNVSVSDISGRVILNSRVNGYITIDISKWESGIYFVTYNEQTKKIVVIN